MLIFRDITERKKAEEAIKRSEVRFRSLFESSFDGVLIAQSDGSIISANPAACRIFGMSEEELKNVGREGILVMDKRVMAAIAERTLTGKVKGEFTCRRKDGSTFECDVSSSIFKEADGSVKTALIIRDITERKKAEDALKSSEKHYRSLFVNMEEGFSFNKIVYDEVGKAVDFVVLEANKVFEDTTGLKREKVIGKRLSEAYARAYEDLGFQNVFQVFAKVAETGKSERFELYSRSMGKWLVGLVYSPMKGYFAVLDEDVTERKQTEKKLDEYRESLEKLVEERTKQLKDSERLAAIGATAGMVGHDIRNPLQAITSDVYLAKSDLAFSSRK